MRSTLMVQKVTLKQIMLLTVVPKSTVHLSEDQVSEINRLVPDPLTDVSNHSIHH